jgi:hypothetical protein
VQHEPQNLPGGGSEHHSVGHFEPQPPLEGGGGRPSKPYVVWSSAPSDAAHGPGSEE